MLFWFIKKPFQIFEANYRFVNFQLLAWFIANREEPWLILERDHLLSRFSWLYFYWFFHIWLLKWFFFVDILRLISNQSNAMLCPILSLLLWTILKLWFIITRYLKLKWFFRVIHWLIISSDENVPIYIHMNFIWYYIIKRLLLKLFDTYVVLKANSNKCLECLQKFDRQQTSCSKTDWFPGWMQLGNLAHK